MCTAKHDHIQPVLQSRHWLPIPSGIKYKALLLTYKCINGTSPVYLQHPIKPYKPTHTIRPADQSLLQMQKGKHHTMTYMYCAFVNCAPVLWKIDLSITDPVTLFIVLNLILTHMYSDIILRILRMIRF